MYSIHCQLDFVLQVAIVAGQVGVIGDVDGLPGAPEVSLLHEHSPVLFAVQATLRHTRPWVHEHSFGLFAISITSRPLFLQAFPSCTTLEVCAGMGMQRCLWLMSIITR